MALRFSALLAACAGLVVLASAHAAAGSGAPARSCDAAGVCGQVEELETSALLQSFPTHHASAAGYHHCSTRSLIISKEVGEDTYLQWNAELRANGADSAEFLNLTNVNGPGPVRFETDVEFVKHGRPVFGIVLIRLLGVQVLAKQDAARLKAYLNAGGMLVVGESSPEQVNALMEDLGSSIRQQEVTTPEDVPCTTPENAPYVPSKAAAWCPITHGVTGLQGDNLDEVIDPKGSSYPLFHLKSSPSVVVAREEKGRSLVVVGDDEPFDDDCATEDDGNNRLAHGLTTNLRFFANLFQQRCRHGR